MFSSMWTWFWTGSPAVAANPGSPAVPANPGPPPTPAIPAVPATPAIPPRPSHRIIGSLLMVALVVVLYFVGCGAWNACKGVYGHFTSGSTTGSNKELPRPSGTNYSDWSQVSELAASRDDEEKKDLIVAIQDLGCTDSFPAMITLLCDPNPAVAEKAKSAILKLAANAAKKDLTSLSGTDRASEEKKAEIGKEMISCLVKALDSSNDQLKIQAGRCLIEVGTPAVDDTVKLLGSNDEIVRDCAKRILYRIPSAKDALQKVFDDTSKPAIMRLEARSVLRWISDKKTPECLLKKRMNEATAKAAADQHAQAVKEAEQVARLEAAITRALIALETRQNAKASGNATALLAAITENSQAMKVLAGEVKTSRAMGPSMNEKLDALLHKADQLRATTPPPTVVAPPAPAPVPAPAPCYGRRCPTRW